MISGHVIRSWKSGLEVTPVESEGLARPDLLHDVDRLDHLPRQLSYPVEPVQNRVCVMSSGSHAEKVSTLEHLRQPTDANGERGRVVVGQ